MTSDHWVFVVLIVCAFTFLSIVAWRSEGPPKPRKPPKPPTWTYKRTERPKDERP